MNAFFIVKEGDNILIYFGRGPCMQYITYLKLYRNVEFQFTNNVKNTLIRSVILKSVTLH